MIYIYYLYSEDSLVSNRSSLIEFYSFFTTSAG